MGLSSRTTRWVGIVLILASCRSKANLDADAGPTASAARIELTPSSASSAAAIDDPDPPKDPTDPDALLASVLVDASMGGWDPADHTLVDRVAAPEELKRHDAACIKKVAPSCTLAALAHAELGDYPAAQESALSGCKLDDRNACGFLVSAWFDSHVWGRASYTFDIEQKPGESEWSAALRRAVELCDAGVGFTCYIAGRVVSDARFKAGWSERDKGTMLDRAYDLHVRACALGAFGGCHEAIDEVAVGGKQNDPDRGRQVARLVNLATRLCERRAGACPSLAADVVRLGPAGEVSESRRKALLERGCSAKTDPTFTARSCALLAKP